MTGRYGWHRPTSDESAAWRYVEYVSPDGLWGAYRSVTGGERRQTANTWNVVARHPGGWEEEEATFETLVECVEHVAAGSWSQAARLAIAEWDRPADEFLADWGIEKAEVGR